MQLTLWISLMRHAQSHFSIFFFGGGGGGGGTTCEHCNIYTVTGEGTSFWNIVSHSIIYH